MVKVTFTLDEATVDQLRRAAERVGQPQSQVVRTAIREYTARLGKLTEDERLAFLRAFDTLVPRIRARPASEVDAELRELRVARRRGGRRSPAR